MNLGKILMLFKKHADEIVENFYTDFFIDVFYLMKKYENTGELYEGKIEHPVAMVFRTHGTNTLELSPKGEIDILDKGNNSYLSGHQDIKRIVKVVGDEVEIIEGNKLKKLIQSCKNVPDYLLR